MSFGDKLWRSGLEGSEEVVGGEGCDGTFFGGGLRLVSVYQPIWGTDETALEGCRGEMERQVEMGVAKS